MKLWGVDFVRVDALNTYRFKFRRMELRRNWGGLEYEKLYVLAIRGEFHSDAVSLKVQVLHSYPCCAGH